MKVSRRKFIGQSSAAIAGSGFFTAGIIGCDTEETTNSKETTKDLPKVVSTWDAGIAANEAAWAVLNNGGRALDAVETGVRVTESDLNNMTVGIGAHPDREGDITLDACIMNEKGDAGSVCFLKDIEHPISVARKVMEETPHVMLAGDGAFQFALSQGFKKKDLMTEKSKKAYSKWLEKSEYNPIINVENHDTISMIALDSKGNLSGACTTSGLAYKMKGRVGDSPVIGAGLFVDNEIGGACATGLGEAVLKTLGSFLIVEFMRNGLSPQKACEKAIGRIVDRMGSENFQIGYLAMSKYGEVGAYSIHKGFNFAQYNSTGNNLIPSDFMKK